MMIIEEIKVIEARLGVLRNAVGRGIIDSRINLFSRESLMTSRGDE